MSWVEARSDDTEFDSIIVGGGPGGMGPLLWAAQQGLLPDWLRRGVAVVERDGHLGGSLGRYGICSDSLGSSYLECLDSELLPRAFDPVRRTTTTLEMQRYRTGFPPLALVDRYIRQIGRSLATTIEHQPASALHLHSTAQSIHMCRDGKVGVLIRDGSARPRMLTARSVVVALGGRQPWQAQRLGGSLPLAACTRARVLPSDAFFGHSGLARSAALLRTANGRPIVVLGGSHSAYAATWALLQLPGADRLGEGQIVILQRRPPRVFYPDAEDAAADGYGFAPGDLCLRTGRVNRMGGLRGHGRDAWRRIAQRPHTAPEPRIVVIDSDGLSEAQIQAIVGRAALVIPCLGYRSRTLPVWTAEGRRLDLKADRDEDAVGEDCRLLLADGTSLPNVFGIGLGTGYRPTEAMGCEPNFAGQANSLWLYQNDIGALIYRAVHEAFSPPAGAARLLESARI